MHYTDASLLVVRIQIMAKCASVEAKFSLACAIAVHPGYSLDTAHDVPSAQRAHTAAVHPELGNST